MDYGQWTMDFGPVKKEERIWHEIIERLLHIRGRINSH